MIRTISRLIVGAVFIFSGFVKGLDPMGTMFKLEDYFIAYGTEWAMPLALPLSILLCTVEFSLGILLVFNTWKNISRTLLLLMMAFFTVLTFFDAVYNPVPDCGCFGEAIILTNWETFYKNVILMVFTLIVFWGRKKAKGPYSAKAEKIISLSVITLVLAFCTYSYHRLPIIDFRDWKVGKDMAPDDMGEPITYLIYQNKNTGDTEEYLASELPWQDSIWMAEWEFTDQRIDDSHVVKPHELQIIDSTDNDLTTNFIENPHYQFLLISYDLTHANKKGLKKAEKLYQSIDTLGYSFIMLTNALQKDIKKFRTSENVGYEIYNADDIVLKTMVRSNPGLMLMKDGIIINKWHYHHFPDNDEILQEYLK